MPPIRMSLSSTDRRAQVVAVILLLGEVILSCSRCSKKGLVYTAIITPLDRQPSSCSKCTSLNIQLSYNVRSVSNAEYIFYIYLYLYSSHSNNRNTWYCVALLALLYTL